MKDQTQQLKTVKFWINHQLKPFVRINPIIKHNHVDNLGAKELLKQFNKYDLGVINNNLQIDDILVANMPDQDKKEFLLMHFKELRAITK